MFLISVCYLGSLPFGDIEFGVSYGKRAIMLLNRLTTEFKDRVRSDLVRKVVFSS